MTVLSSCHRYLPPDKEYCHSRLALRAGLFEIDQSSYLDLLYHVKRPRLMMDGCPSLQLLQTWSWNWVYTKTASIMRYRFPAERVPDGAT